MTEARNEYGVVGLGWLGGNLSRQALEKGIRVVGFTRHGAPPDMIEAGLVEVRSYKDLKAELSPPRAIFIYIPAGPTVDKVLDDLATEDGYVHAGPPGAGQFTKLVHNGIEFGMLQAIGEGVDLLQH